MIDLSGKLQIMIHKPLRTHLVASLFHNWWDISSITPSNDNPFTYPGSMQFIFLRCCREQFSSFFQPFFLLIATSFRRISTQWSRFSFQSCYFCSSQISQSKREREREREGWCNHTFLWWKLLAWIPLCQNVKERKKCRHAATIHVYSLL